MKRSLLSKLPPVTAVAVGIFLARGAQATTEITFGGFGADNINISSIPGYGSNVSQSSVDYIASTGIAGFVGTPNIALTWGIGYQTYTSWDGRGNVAQLDFNLSPTIDLVFNPAPGAGVLINSFYLDEWAGGGDQSVNWEVIDPNGTLASGTWVRNTGGRDLIETGLNPGNVAIDSPITLRFTQTSGALSYVALDNLTFDQVPEPSTLALGLLGAGLGALAMRRKKTR